MHSYSVKNDNKNLILNVILIISGLFDLIINIILSCFINLINGPLIYFIIFLSTYLASYKFIYNLYDEKLWKSKYLVNFNKHPDISGIWGGTIYNEEYSIKVNVEIKQTWSGIVMILTTDSAYSKTKCLFIDNEDKIRLNYIYFNETKGLNNQELRNHEGTGSLLISDDLKYMEGEYYTNHHRKTVGVIKLEKIY